MKRNRVTILIGLWIAFILITSSCQSHGSYYVDNINGSDSNNGKSPEHAWKSIDQVNNSNFQPGDDLLFFGGQLFKGTILFRSSNSGVEKNHITISSYGDDRATISGGDTCALVADSCQFLTIQNLNFTESGRKTGNTTSGVVIKKGSDILSPYCSLEAYFQDSAMGGSRNINSVDNR